MCILLINDNENTFYITNCGWRSIQRLAKMYGWIPKGTLMPERWLLEEPFDPDNYSTSDGQIVTATDANELANAIEWAITQLEEKPVEEEPLPPGMDWEEEEIRLWEDAMQLGIRNPTILSFHLGWERRLTELVILCREGEFKIY